MAQKHRFKKNREFKQRLEEEESNEEGDIRSFKFHSFPAPGSHSQCRFGNDDFRGRKRGGDDLKGRHDDDDFKGRRRGEDFKNRRRGDDFRGHSDRGNRRGSDKFGKNRRFEDED